MIEAPPNMPSEPASLPISRLLCEVGLKYSAMLLRWSSLEAPSSHMSRKNAIMAVIMSARAIFQAPPWAPHMAVSDNLLDDDRRQGLWRF